MSKLAEREIDKARLAFLEYDKDGSGSIDHYELKFMLEKMDIKASEADIFNMISEIDSDQSGEISFSEFLKVIDYQKSLNANNDTADILSAYIACGGNPDKSGHVDRRVISKIILADFGLEIGACMYPHFRVCHTCTHTCTRVPSRRPASLTRLVAWSANILFG